MENNIMELFKAHVLYTFVFDIAQIAMIVYIGDRVSRTYNKLK
jgi:hypothetical protein